MTISFNDDQPNIVRGGAGNDEFLVAFQGLGGGDDQFRGIGGDDTAEGGIDDDELYGGLGDDILDGGEGNDYLNGGPGDDTLTLRLGGQDIADGGGGNDTIEGSEGGTVNGGTGKDRFAFGFPFGVVVLDLLRPVPFPFVFDSIEEFMGGNFGDTFKGTAGKDVFFGSHGNDILIGRGGDDILDGSGSGGFGPDQDKLNGGAGNDKLYGGFDSDRLVGGYGIDLLDTGGVNSSGGDDTALGGAGNDTLSAADGDDVLNGGTGSDTAILYATFGDVRCDLQLSGPFQFAFDATVALISIENVILSNSNQRADWLFGNIAANQFDAGNGDDWLMGRGGNDILLGSDGNDKLEGGGGNDSLKGGTGADLLSGGSGQDTMTGGTEIDTFGFAGVADSPAATRDRITDFVSGTDRISFQDFVDLSDAVSPGPRDVTFTFIGNGNFSGTADEVRFAGGVLEADSDRDGVADLAIVLTGVTSLVLADFLF